MIRSSFFVTLLFAAIIIAPKSSVVYALQQTHWVAPNGNDAQTCTVTTPCKTINHVLQAVVSDGDVINILPGIYREQLEITLDNITLQGTAPGVFLYGAAVPELVPAEGKYTAPWVWGDSFDGTPFCNNLTNDVGMDDRLCNTLGFWENEQRLAQVLSKSAVVAGTFYYDAGAEAVWLQPYAGSDGLAAIEGATYPYVLKLSASSSGVALKDLSIWYGTSMPDDGILQVEGSDHLIENVDVRYTAGAGILVYGADRVTMQDVEAAAHGQNGWRIRADASFSTSSGWQINDWVDALVLDHAISRNNGWKGYDNCWGGGGTKFSFTRDLQIDRFYSADNNGFGIWLDIENHTYDVTSSLSARDAGRGIFVEYISDDGRVENNVVFNTQDADNIGCGISVGLAAADSRNVTIKNNTVYSTADDVKGIMLKTGCPTCRSFPYTSEDIVWENNLLINKGDAGFVRDLDAGSADPFTYSNMHIEESFAGDGTVAVCWDALGNCSQAAFDIEALPPGTYLADEADECGFSENNALLDGVGAQGFVHPQHAAICDGAPPPAPPVAGFTYAVEGMLVMFTDTSADDEALVAWSWDFGDGSSSSEQSPEYAYAAAGTYAVLLTVTDSDGLSDTFSEQITIDSPAPPAEPPVADFTYTATALTVQFEDLSTDDGTLVSWLWTFGDGNQASTQDPTHSYSDAGTYSVSLLVEDDEGLSATQTRDVVVEEVDLPTPPSAAFTFTVDNLQVTFQDASTDDGSVVAWLWEFGDGEVATSATTSHTYMQAGTYTVVLTVTDDEGLTASVAEEVMVSSPPVDLPPVAAFTFVVDGLSVQFTDLSTDEDGEVAGWLWDFGDGETATLQHPVHVYTTAGSYYVTLEVKDDTGLKGDVGIQLLLIEGEDDVTGTFVEVAGLVVMEAEHHVAQSANGITGDTWIEAQIMTGSETAVGMQVLPDNGHSVTANFMVDNATLHFPVLFITTGTYYIWVRMRPEADASTIYAGTAESASMIGETRFDKPVDTWVWYNTKNASRRARINVPATGEQLIQVWMREDGVVLDRLLLTTDPDYVPEGVGPAESPRVLIDPYPNGSHRVSDRLDMPLQHRPTSIRVGHFYPNPATSDSHMSLDLPDEAQVSVLLYDMIGRVWHSEQYVLNAGANQKLRVDTSRLAAGVYICQIRVLLAEGSQTFSRRLVVVPFGAP